MRERMVDTVDSLPHKMAASLPLLVADLRASVRQLEAAVQEAASHEGMKDSKVVWVGENRILTSGFSQNRSGNR